jgi:hypothetical protein
MKTDDKSLIRAKEMDNYIYRQNALFLTDICFNNICSEFIFDSNIRSDHVILFGDLGYRIMGYDAHEVAGLFLRGNATPERINSLYKVSDELYSEIKKGNIAPFSEGVNNSGINFPPTYKMKIGHTSDCYLKTPTDKCWELGKNNELIPSWPDRILYNDVTRDNGTLNCLIYDRFDIQNEYRAIAKSDHVGVISLIEVRRN